MWKLVIADDEGQKTVVNLVREEYTLGRAEGHSVRLTERNISRNHAVIRRTPVGFCIEDQSSYNGLYLNGVRVIGRQDIAHGDLIQLGDYRVRVIDETIDTQEQGYKLLAGESSPPPSGRLPHRLVELIGPKQGAEYPLEGERFLIGRGTECEFPIDHGSVSRVHAEIRTIGDGKFEIVDKGSANGLRINGHTMAQAILDSRDVIELGDVVLKYIPQGQVFKVSASEGARIAVLAGSDLPPSPEKKARSSIVLALSAAGFGAILVTAVGLALSRTEAQPDSDSALAPAPAPKELASAAILLQEGKLQAVAQKFEGLSAAERALAAYENLESEWAEAVLRASQESQGDEEYRVLLDKVARRETLADSVRERASKKLSALDEGAIDIESLDEAPEEPGTAKRGE